MLTPDQIKNSFGEDIFAKNPRGALVEYLQYELLDSLFKQKESEKLSFIGGTAIRIVYDSQRFSEDLDFDNFGLSFEKFGALLEKTADDMRIKNFEIELRMVEKMAYHCYIKFPEILFQHKLSPFRDEKILIRVDTMHKSVDSRPALVTLNRFGIYRKIFANPPEIILAQKIIAIFEREKGRDLFDVSYLFSLTNAPDYEYLKKQGGLREDGLKEKLLKRVGEFDLKKMAKDVEPFLIVPEQIARVETFPEFIKEKI